MTNHRSEQQQTVSQRFSIRMAQWFTEHRFEALVFLGYIILTLIVTYPLILNLNHGIYGFPGDSTGTIWNIWRIKYALNHGISQNVINLIAAPFGADVSTVPQTPGQMYPPILIALLTNEILAYNICVLLTFPVAGITMFYLVRYLTKNNIAAALAGLVFAFAPYHFAHAVGHLGITMAYQWLPMFVLMLVKLCEKQSLKRLAAVGIVFALVCLTDYYNGYMVGILAVSFVLFLVFFKIFVKKDLRVNEAAKVILAALGSLFLSVLIMLPFVLPIFQQAIKNPSIYARSTGDLIMFSARPWDYLIPSPDNPIVGGIVSPFVYSHMHGSNPAEQTLFLGYTTMILAFLAVILTAARRRNRINNDILQRNQLYIFGFAVSAFVALVISAPPYIPVGKYQIPLFSSFAFELAPMFRVYARFGAIVLLCSIVVASFAVAFFTERLQKRGRILLSILLVCAVIAEFANVPPFRVTIVDNPAPVYSWLQQQPGDFIVAEYPIVVPDSPILQEYVFAQRWHVKRLLNGAQSKTEAESFTSLIEDISKQTTPPKLKRMGIKYLIVHWDKYDVGRPSEIASGLRLKRNFPTNTSVYEVIAKPMDTLVMPLSGFGAPEKQKDGSYWRWTGDKATISVTNYTKKTITGGLVFKALSFSKVRTLAIIQSGRPAQRIAVTIKPQQFQVMNLVFPPGRSVLTLETNETAQVIDSVLHNGDERRVSIMYSEFAVAGE